jgi:hypothetical protein
MTVLSGKDQREIAVSNVIRFPRTFVQRDVRDDVRDMAYIAGSQGGLAKELAAEIPPGRIQADYRALSDLINTIADARAMIVRLENEIRIRKTAGDKTTPL